jgi:hypothetical protein
MAAALRTVLDSGSVLDSRIAFALTRELASKPDQAFRPQLTGRERRCSTCSRKAPRTA